MFVLRGTGSLEEYPRFDSKGVADGYWLELMGGLVDEGREPVLPGNSESEVTTRFTGRMTESPITTGLEARDGVSCSLDGGLNAPESHIGLVEEELLS